MSGPNSLLRACRLARHESQAEFAAALRRNGAPASCSARLVQRWEAGETTWPHPVYRRALTAMTGMGLAELGFFDPSAPIEDDEMHRRNLITAAAGITAAAAIEPYARLHFALTRGPGRIDQPLADHLYQVTSELYDREATTTAAILAPELGRHLDALAGLLSVAQDEQVRRTLTLAAGEAAALGGWLAHDQDRMPDAYGYWNAATRAAKVCGDGPLLALVLCYTSYAAAAQGEHAAAWHMLDGAGQQLRSRAHAAPRAWIAARAAEEAAALGETGPALVSLERAMTAYDYADPGQARPWVRFFDNSRLGSMAVNTYGRLQHPELQPAADAVMASLTPDRVKTKAIILSDVATAKVAAGDLDAGCELAHRALKATLDGQAILGRQRLSVLRSMLDEHQAAEAVRSLLPALDAAGITAPAAA